MAKNWKVGEAARAIQAGNTADILDLGRRFPLFTVLVAQTNEAGMKLLDCIPDYVSARKIESVLKGDAQETEADTDAEDEVAEEETPKKKEAPAKKAPEKKATAKPAKKAEPKEEEDELEGKSAKELFDMCKEAGLKVKPKQDKAVYIKALKDAEAKAEAEEAEDDDWGEEADEPPKKAAPKKEAKKSKKVEEDEDDWEV